MLDLTKGSVGEYHWIQNINAVGLELLEAVPEIAEQTYILITSIDGGPMQLQQIEREHGFSSLGTFIVCPPATDLDLIPEGGANEWHFFRDLVPSHAESMETFANVMPFHLAYDPAIEHLQQSFWNQLFEFRPESYVCDTNLLLFVTKDELLYARAVDWLTVKVSANDRKC